MPINNLNHGKNSLEMDNWIKHFQNKHLTIKDLKNWNVGETINVVIFDRNFPENMILHSFKEKRSN